MRSIEEAPSEDQDLLRIVAAGLALVPHLEFAVAVGSRAWGGASEASDLDVLVFINLPFMGQDPRWDEVNLSQSARAIVKSVAIEVSPISYTPDTLGPIWTRDAEVLIWRRRK